MIAILSDVHGNLEALTAVLDDIKRQGAQAIYNLGDTFGYGANPVECLELAMEMKVGILGNFDHAVLFGADGFCETAERSILWTRALLDASKDCVAGRNREDYLRGLPQRHHEGDVLYVHGSASNPLNEYVYPEHIDDLEKMDRIADSFSRLCFCGHTHIPGIFRQNGTSKWEYIHAEECENGFTVSEKKMICNVGSVGQPWDDDERACYAMYDGQRIWLRRVEYDVEATIRKIYAVPELDNFLGDRLRKGR